MSGLSSMMTTKAADIIRLDSVNVTTMNETDVFAPNVFTILERKPAKLLPVEGEFGFVVLVMTVWLPSKVGLAYKGVGCSGTFINVDLVLTTASCVTLTDKRRPRPSNTFIRLSHMTENFEITDIYVHPLYEPFSDHYNLALLEINGIFNFSRLGHLPTSWRDPEDVINNCMITGFGKSGNLMTAALEVMNLNQTGVRVTRCRHPRLEKLCLDFPNMTACQTDVGSPVICDGEVYAIYTPNRDNQAVRCYDRYGAIFTPIFPVKKDWIDKILSQRDLQYFDFLSNPIYIILIAAGVLVSLGIFYCTVMIFYKKRFDETLHVANEISTELEYNELSISKESSTTNV